MLLRLNLGCGENLLDGFVNIDLYDVRPQVVKTDIAGPLPYESGSVDKIVCYQTIEHVPYNKSQTMFAEWCRVLKPGAHAIVETPDIDVIARKILMEDGLTDQMIYNLVGEYYRPWDKDRYDDWEMNAASIHRNPWNFGRLSDVALSAGFTRIGRRTPDYYAEFEETMSCRLTK